MPELKTECGHIEKFKTSTEIRDVLEKGEVVEHQIITKVSFEVAGIPDGIPMIHHALANDVVVDVLIGSHQALMNVDMVTGEIKGR